MRIIEFLKMCMKYLKKQIISCYISLYIAYVMDHTKIHSKLIDLLSTLESFSASLTKADILKKIIGAKIEAKYNTLLMHFLSDS